MIYPESMWRGRMTKDRQIPIAKPATGDEEWQAAKAPLMRGWLTQGSEVASFEASFANMHQVDHAIATTSGTSALHLSLLALGIGPGDEVIVPAFTWVSTANAVRFCGADVVFADVELSTFNLSPESVKQALSPRTRAIIAVHLFGLCAPLTPLRALTGSIPVIEDAACAAGSRYNGHPAGSLGEMAAFSFHPRKSITTGEGGMVTTNNAEWAQKIKTLRNHGIPSLENGRDLPLYPPGAMADIQELGFNYRMTDIQAAIGRVQLQKLDRFIDERAELAQYYGSALSECPWIQTPVSPSNDRHAWQSYVCMISPESAPDSRDNLIRLLQEQGISTRPGTHAVHELSLYRQEEASCPNASLCARHSLAIPFYNGLCREDCDRVVSAIMSL